MKQDRIILVFRYHVMETDRGYHISVLRSLVLSWYDTIH
jgi:hypothetical protein